MRILSILNSIAFANAQVEFKNTWYYQVGSHFLKNGNTINNISDKNMRFEYLEERAKSQYRLFDADIILVHLFARDESAEKLLKYLEAFQKNMREKDKIYFLPTQIKKLNEKILSDVKSNRFFHLQKFETLINSYGIGNSQVDHNLIAEYIKAVV